MEISRIVESLKNQDWYEGQIEHLELLPEREAEYGRADFDRRIKDFLERKGLDLFSHQSRAINLIKEGRDVIITTPTASGKTLASQT